MNGCAICGLPTPRKVCQFDAKTVDLIKERRCVACTKPIHPGDSIRAEGKCAECREAHVRLSAPTRKLLRQAARARVIVGR